MKKEVLRDDVTFHFCACKTQCCPLVLLQSIPPEHKSQTNEVVLVRGVERFVYVLK